MFEDDSVSNIFKKSISFTLLEFVGWWRILGWFDVYAFDLLFELIVIIKKKDFSVLVDNEDSSNQSMTIFIDSLQRVIEISGVRSFLWIDNKRF